MDEKLPGILTTDLKPKLAMEECKIGNTLSKNLWNCKRLGNDIIQIWQQH